MFDTAFLVRYLRQENFDCLSDAPAPSCSRELELPMSCLSCRIQILLLVWLPVALPTLVGCQPSAPTLSKEAGTTAAVELPESDPPVLTKAVAERIKPGMSQEEVLGILQKAGSNTPTAKSSLEVVGTQGKLNTIRYVLTVTQGKRKLVLAFKNAKLAEKKQEGLE